jgi:glycosyltransferase involved in cell wall biosynthesis
VSGPPRISVAVPVYNEEAVLPELYRRLRDVLDSLPGGPHEMVFTDDGSSDRTAALLEELAARDPRIVAVCLSRNFGHQAALCAALDHATGEAVVTMDGDLQDAPEVIPRFLAEHAKGYDVVYARRTGRKESVLLRVCYYLFYRLLKALSSHPIPTDAGDFCLMSRRAVEALRTSPERHRYLRGLRSWIGFRQIGLDVERDARPAGHTKYSLSRLLALAFDGLFAFSVVPLRAASVLGLLAISASALYTLYALWARFVLSQSPRGFTALIVAIVFLAGVQLFFLGIIGEYVGRVYEEAKGRPVYIVQRVIRRT